MLVVELLNKTVRVRRLSTGHAVETLIIIHSFTFHLFIYLFIICSQFSYECLPVVAVFFPDGLFLQLVKIQPIKNRSLHSSIKVFNIMVTWQLWLWQAVLIIKK